MKKSFVGALLVFAAGTLWGFMGVFVRGLSNYGFDSLQITALRLVAAAIFMIIFTLIVKPSAFKIRLKDIWCFIGSGIISLATFSCAYFATIEMTSMSMAAILLYTAPIMVTVMSAFLFKEKLTAQKLFCLAAAFVGCFMVAGLSSEALSAPPIAVVTGLISGFAYALYSIFGRFAINRGYSSITISLYTFIFASLGVLPLANIGGIVTTVSQNPPIIPFSLSMGVLTAFLPYVLYTAGLERMESGKASIIASVEPVVATICGMIFFNEFPDLFGWVGIVLVIGAIVFLNVNLKAKKD